jgi:hypothetical protein
MTSRQYFLIILAVFASIGMIALDYATPWGIGITADSVTYFEVARNLLNLKGFTVAAGTPLTHYPPMYPLLLAIVGSVGNNLLSAARWLEIALFGSNIFLIGLAVRYCTPNSLITPLFGSLMMASSLSMFAIHGMAWSEATFILFGFGGLFFLSLYIRGGGRTVFLVSSICVGFACMTRYAGVSLVFTGLLGILLLSKKDFVKRLIDIVVWGACSSFLTVLWVIRNRLATETMTNRQIVFHPIGTEHLQTAAGTMSQWLFYTYKIPVAIGAFVLVAGLFIVAYILFHEKEQETETGLLCFSRLTLLFAFVYGITLVFSISFVDAHTPLNNRILSPVYVAGLVASLSVVFFFSHKAPLLKKLVISLICGMIICCQAYMVKPLVDVWRKEGVMFSSRQWAISPILNFVKKMPRDTIIYTNGPDALSLFDDRNTSLIPAIMDPVTRRQNNQFKSQVDQMREELARKNGVVVYFDLVFWRWYLPRKEDLAQYLHLDFLYRGTDGTVYCLSSEK